MSRQRIPVIAGVGSGDFAIGDDRGGGDVAVPVASGVAVVVPRPSASHAERMLAQVDEQLAAARAAHQEAALAFAACLDLAATISDAAEALELAALKLGAVYSHRKLLLAIVAAKKPAPGEVA